MPFWRPQTISPSHLIQLGLILIPVYLTSFFSYLLFHSLIEIIITAITFGIFIVAWNSRRFFRDSNYFLFIGTAFCAIGILNIFHALAYKGMGVFPQAGTKANIATELWLATQFVLSLSLLAAPFLIKRRLEPRIIFMTSILLLAGLLLSIFYWNIFPDAYIEGLGLTPFKIHSEYVIMILLLLSLVFFYHKRAHIHETIFRLLAAVIILFIISEYFFTIYIGVYDIFNLLGHLIRLVAFYLSYIAIVEIGLMRPYNLLFRELRDSELALGYERDKLQNILDAIANGIYIVNRDNEIIYANPALIRDFGQLKTEQKCYEYLHGRSDPCTWCKNEKVFQGESVRWECLFESNHKTYDLVDTPIIAANGVKAKMTIFHDITEKKEIERAKEEFISLAAHQLRTPLSSISLSSELLLRGIGGAVPAEQKGYVEEIHKTAKRMNILVSNFLNVSRIELGQLPIDETPINIGKTIDQLVSELAPLAQDKHLILKKDIDLSIPIIEFDENILRLIIDNLITNAIRYTPPGGNISVTVKGTALDVHITIADTGCGIPENQQEKIFQKSFRADNARSISSQGAGLGLYMVKALIDRVGAKIWFESKPNKGTTFFLIISPK